MIRPPMLPCPSSGLQAPSVKIIHVSASGFPTLIGGELRTRSRKSRRLLLIESSKRFLPPLSTQNRPRFFTAALAVRPKVNPSKNIIRPLSLSASLASNQSSARMSLIFESNSLLRSSVCPITISLSLLPLRSISNPTSWTSCRTAGTSFHPLQNQDLTVWRVIPLTKKCFPIAQFGSAHCSHHRKQSNRC